MAKESDMTQGGRYMLCMPSPKASTLASLETTPIPPLKLSPDKDQVKDGLYLRSHPAGPFPYLILLLSSPRRVF